MPARPFSLRLASLCVALAGWCVLAAVPAARADNPWTVVKYGNGEYLTLRNVAQFYHLQYSRAEGKAVVSARAGYDHQGRHRLEGTHHQRHQGHHDRRPGGS